MVSLNIDVLTLNVTMVMLADITRIISPKKTGIFTFNFIGITPLIIGYTNLMKKTVKKQQIQEKFVNLFIENCPIQFFIERWQNYEQ